MRIGLDVDGVMYHFQKTYCYMMNTMKGYSLDYEKWSEWDWPEKNGVTNNDKQWIWSKGVELGLFRYGHLYKGTIEGVRQLAVLGDIVVITHRPRNAVQDTLDWLAYLRLPFREIHIQSEKGALKSAIQPHCDLYVDDKSENIYDYLTATSAKALLWTRPWNVAGPDPWAAQDVLTGIVCTDMYEGRGARTNTWKEVVNIAQSIHDQG